MDPIWGVQHRKQFWVKETGSQLWAKLRSLDIDGAEEAFVAVVPAFCGRTSTVIGKDFKYFT